MTQYFNKDQLEKVEYLLSGRELGLYFINLGYNLVLTKKEFYDEEFDHGKMNWVGVCKYREEKQQDDFHISNKIDGLISALKNIDNTKPVTMRKENDEVIIEGFVYETDQ